MFRKWFELILVTCIFVTSTSFLVKSSPLPHQNNQDYTTLKYWEIPYRRDKEVTTIFPGSFSEGNAEGSEETIVVLSDDDSTITTNVPLTPENLIVRQEHEDDELEHLYEPSGTTVTFLSEYITNQPKSKDEISITNKPPEAILETVIVRQDEKKIPENVIVRQEEEKSPLFHEFAQVVEALGKEKVVEGNKIDIKQEVSVQNSVLEVQDQSDHPASSSTPEVIVREEEVQNVASAPEKYTPDLNDQVIEKIVSELQAQGEQLPEQIIIQSTDQADQSSVVTDNLPQQEDLWDEKKNHGNVDETGFGEKIYIPEKHDTQPIVASAFEEKVSVTEKLEHVTQPIVEIAFGEKTPDTEKVEQVTQPIVEIAYGEKTPDTEKVEHVTQPIVESTFAEKNESITEKNEHDTEPIVQKVIVRQEEEEDDSEEDEEASALASQNSTTTEPPTKESSTPVPPTNLEVELPSEQQQQQNSTLIDVQSNQNPEQSVQQGQSTASSLSSTTVREVELTEATTTVKPTTKKPINQGVQDGLIPFVEAFNSQSHQIGLKHRHKLDSSISIVPVLEKSEYPDTPRPPRPPRTTTFRPRTTTTPKPRTTTPTTTTKPPPANIEQLSFEEEWNKANRVFTMTNIGQGRADCECGKVPFKVDSGDTAGVNQYPWTVAIVRTGIFGGNIASGKPHCSGSLINNKFVLTTASCVESFYPESIQVWLTALNSLSSDNYVSSDFILKRDVKEILMHPNYDRRSNDNDVALIRFNQPIDISAASYYVPVCLPAGEGSYDGMFARVVGWTGSSKVNNRLTTNNQMCKEDVPVISNTVCNRDTTHKNRITVNQVCAGYLSRLPAETCHMDGGGPLTIPNGGRFTLIGLVSYGHTQRQSYTPIVYSRVGSYADWILHNTQDAEWCSL